MRNMAPEDTNLDDFVLLLPNVGKDTAEDPREDLKEHKR